MPWRHRLVSVVVDATSSMMAFPGSVGWLGEHAVDAPRLLWRHTLAEELRRRWRFWCGYARHPVSPVKFSAGVAVATVESEAAVVL